MAPHHFSFDRPTGKSWLACYIASVAGWLRQARNNRFNLSVSTLFAQSRRLAQVLIAQKRNPATEVKPGLTPLGYSYLRVQMYLDLDSLRGLSSKYQQIFG